MSMDAKASKNDAISLEKLKDAIDDAAHDASDKAHAAVDKGREVLSRGREAVSDFSGEAGQYAARKAEAGYRGTADFIRERPLSALALAFGAGMLGALLLRRR